MGGVRAGADLAELLNELKRRSGYSYEQIAGKTHFSRSSVHRYCSGQGVPATFGGIERIATVCGASRSELTRLYRLWDEAGSAPAGNPAGSPAPQQAGPPVAAEPPPVREASGPRSRRTRPNWALIAVLSVVALLGPSGYPMTSPQVADAQGGRTIGAPMWTDVPQPIDPRFLGVTVNSTTGLMPELGAGSVRLWDSGTQWQDIEPSRDRYDWTVLDRQVAGARAAGLPVSFTFGGTPGWASPSGPRTTYGNGSRTSPPDDLGEWGDFVRAVAERYRGRIESYELWDMANHPKFFTGTVRSLVAMTRRASAEIESADPAATVVCPSMGQLWEPGAMRMMERFGELDGYDHCDAAAVKLHPRSASDPPETMLLLAEEIERSLHRAGAGPPLWNTGPSYESPYQRPVPARLAGDYAVRFYLTGLYARYQRMYFYNWGSAKVPLVLQPAGGPPTEASHRVEELRRWLAGAHIRSCREGTVSGLSEHLWQCEFDSGDGKFLIWWAVRGTATVPAPRWASTVHRLDGSSAPTRPGAATTVTGSPILVS